MAFFDGGKKIKDKKRGMCRKIAGAKNNREIGLLCVPAKRHFYRP